MRHSHGRDAVLSPWQYLWSVFLLNLPVLGLILMIVWACGGTYYLNRRNIARAYLLLLAIVAIVTFLAIYVFKIPVESIPGYTEFTSIMNV